MATTILPEQQDTKEAPKRRLKNYLLDPFLQIKLGVYAIVMSVIAAFSLFVVVYSSMSGTLELILELTDAKDEVKNILTGSIGATMGNVGLVLLIYVLTMVIISIWYTHRLIGPTIAFRRHIGMLIRGQYYARTNLRKGDAFFGVADDLNKLSDLLQSQSKPK